MNNQLQIFKNKNFGQVRMIEKEGKIFAIGSDVAKSLGYSIPSKAINTHCKGVSKMEVPTNGGIQEMLVITEGDIYRLITKSKLPSAEKFESWVFDEVLPQIRKTGSYQSQQNLINGLNETIEQMQETIEEYKSMCKITCSKKRNYTDYIKKALGITKANKEFDRVKARIFLVLGVTKWEDIDFETSKNILSVIDESIRVAKSERPYKQMSYFD